MGGGLIIREAIMSDPIRRVLEEIPGGFPLKEGRVLL